MVAQQRDRRPSYEELATDNEHLRCRVQEWIALAQKQTEQIRRLEESLGLNSTNSSKPPSSDQKKTKQAPPRSIRSLEEVRPRGHRSMTVTDRHQVYVYPKHQYCLAHIKRDLKRFAQGADYTFTCVLSICHLPRHQMLSRVGYRRRRLEDALYDIMLSMHIFLEPYAQNRTWQ